MKHNKQIPLWIAIIILIFAIFISSAQAKKDPTATPEPPEATPEGATATPVPAATVDGILVPPDKDYSGTETFQVKNSDGPYKLTTGTYIFNNIDIQNGTLNIDATNGPVIIYVKGTVTITGQGICNNFNPSDLYIYGTSGNECDWSLHGNSSLRAAIYAPNVNLKLQGSNSGKYSACGSFVGKSVELSGNITLHYDEALGNDNTSTPDYSKLNILQSKWIWVQ